MGFCWIHCPSSTFISCLGYTPFSTLSCQNLLLWFQLQASLHLLPVDHFSHKRRFAKDLCSLPL